MKLCNINHNYDYECEKLVRLFFPFEKIEVLHTEKITEFCVISTLCENNANAILYFNGHQYSHNIILELFGVKDDELALATAIYYVLKEATGIVPKWGLLTGIRPAKLYSRLIDEMGVSSAEDYLENKLLVSKEKLELCRKAHIGEEKIISLNTADSFSLYISVPFCPSRCSYCSFVSHSVQQAAKLIDIYVEKLCEELTLTSNIVKELGLKLKTVYVGGGTPTTLSASQLSRILNLVKKEFDCSHLRELTVEAGRPDTITEEKLLALKNCGVDRISINPQTMNDNVLKIIGRNHTVKQTVESFLLARKLGFDNINMDLIAGLPGDTLESFKKTVDSVVELRPDSVTVHTLSLKRAAFLDKTAGSESETAADMVNYAYNTLNDSSILPYYMYRQSKTVGNLENVGYSIAGKECLYNVYIMDETHTIIACGASAVTKLRQPYGNYIERIFNYKYPYEYINQFDDMLSRKNGIVEFYNKYVINKP